jgi:hypothetical protein
MQQLFIARMCRTSSSGRCIWRVPPAQQRNCAVLHTAHDAPSHGRPTLFAPKLLPATQLLGLVGRDSYHLCDIMDVYDDLRADVPAEGFSGDVLEGRLEVLELVKDEAVYQGGRVAIADKGGMTIPVQLLPSALVLLMQVGLRPSVVGGGG